MNDVDIVIEHLNEIPYLDHKILKDRVIPSLLFYIDQEWHSWILNSNKIIKLNIKPLEGRYFAREPEFENDIYLEFFNFLGQKALRKEIIKPYNGIYNDIMNICASLAKFNLLYEHSKEKNNEVSRMVATEIEYIINVCRSIFDLLQEIISELWENITLIDNSLHKQKLPKSFRKMVLIDEKLMNKNEISKKYSIPPIFSEYYSRYGEFFQLLRKFRDNISHHGSSIEYIFITKRGFGVLENEKPFCLLNKWNESHKLPNQISSLRASIGYIINNTISACEDFSITIQKLVEFPNEISPNLKIFLKMFYSSELLKLDDVIKNSQWYDE